MTKGGPLDLISTSDRGMFRSRSWQVDKVPSVARCQMVERAGFIFVALAPDADLHGLQFALLAEREQVAVDEVGMRGGEAMRQAGIVDLHGACDQLC
jgi:hypothetical protein